MTSRHAVAILTAATLALGATVFAADQSPHRLATADVDGIAREVQQAVHEALRDVHREVRDALRDLGTQESWWRNHESEAARGVRLAARQAARTASDAERSARAGDRDARTFRQVGPTDDPCADQRSHDRDRGHACEVRDTRLPAPGSALTVDASPNGGIRVEAWDQAEVLVRAVVQTWADTDTEARDLLPRVRVQAAGASVSADGPDREGRDHRGWSVSFRVWAPRALALDLTAVNGGVSLIGMHGQSKLRTTNGGLALENVGGQVDGRTTNGGVQVRLAGARWDGAGLSLETTNGGVTLSLPRDYSAALDVSTVNGGFRSEIPIDLPEGRHRSVRTTLGSGGPLVKVQTHNGGVQLRVR